MNMNRRNCLAVVLGIILFAASQLGLAQQGPIKIGMSMPQTGPLGAGGQAALVALRMWVEDVNAKGGLLGRTTVYDQTYPPTTTDFSSLVRAIRQTNADLVFVASYPNDSVAIIRSVNEIGIGANVKLFGGGMVGLQFTPNMVNLGSLLNGIVNYNSYVPGVKYPGIEDFLQRYAKRAVEAKVDPLGFYLPPFNYAIGQMLEQAINATK